MNAHHQEADLGIPKVTEILADWVVGLKDSDIPDPVRREGLRTFVNWVGCAVGGADHETTEAALRAFTPFSGPKTSSVLGRKDKLDPAHAALVNGITSHVLDYDDTHLKTILHPAGPVVSAILALAEMRPISGRDFLTALIAGVEAESRIANCVYPHHYDRGWHITGTAGVFGGAAAVGKMIGLNAQQMRWAFGIAASQASGLREQFGTMTKSFHPGIAARNGMMSALLAESGYDSSERAIEAPRGFAQVMSDKQDWDEIIEGLGTRWESATNSYKPFACGIVIHPTIDGCIQLREQLGDKVGQIAAVKLRTHPLVLELTGRKSPRTELEGKFSVYHCASVALLHGDGAPTAFTDEIVNDAQVVALRSKIEAESNPNCHEAEVEIEVTLTDGSTSRLHVERAIGSAEVPLTDEQINTKFTKQSELVVGAAITGQLLEKSWALESLADAGDVARASVPA
ncbi:MmgE/PrpD family protein [Alkalilacustris brevis]|uniref:MmgE/PrpD family protein n=1 Tax=Alkalilacustris brevis TaxID=2026338 RepID=UPI000E0D1C47|nr:MmgE/PrpD family protein [Alkalilacustris brevis]